MAQTLQYGAAAPLVRLSAASPRSRPVEDADACSSARSDRISRGTQRHAELKSHPDHPVGAGQLEKLYWSRLPLKEDALHGFAGKRPRGASHDAAAA